MVFFRNNFSTSVPPSVHWGIKMWLLAKKKKAVSRPKTMATKISQKVWDYWSPPYLGNIPKNEKKIFECFHNWETIKNPY